LATQPPHFAQETRPLASFCVEVMTGSPEIVTSSLFQMLQAFIGAACHFLQEWQWQIAEDFGLPLTVTSTEPQ
jgi:hypothetical protein